MNYVYYPGCSLKGGGKAYEESMLAVFEELNLKVAEIDDWNCCGATAYMAVDETKAFALAARNLALAEKIGTEIVAPCSACYLGLEKTRMGLEENPELKKEVKKALAQIGCDYQGNLKIRHPLDILVNDVGVKTIAEHVKKPLKGLKLAAYYGCQIVRPYSSFDDQQNPRSMEAVLEALGAEMVPFAPKTKCCGGSLTGTMPEVGMRLCYQLLREAKRQGADLIVTVCPLCQFNLDAYQGDIAAKYENVNVPVVYFTQMMAHAFGLPPAKAALFRSIVSAESVVHGKLANSR